VDRAAELKTRFGQIDTNNNGSLEKSELIAVFGEHADEFLKFCDGDQDGSLTSDEFVNGIVGDCDGMSDEDFQANWLDRMSKCIADAAPADAAPAATLSDQVVTLAPYFKVHNIDEFKKIWQADYADFKHKESCVHYAFCFTEDNRAHCREAYVDAAAALQHLADVDAPLKAVLAPEIAELERLEVHGPADQLEQLKEALTPLGCLFYTAEWGFRPAQPAQEEDTVVHLYPYFSLKEGREADFKKIWSDAYAATQANAGDEKTHQYAFSFDTSNGTTASCRESYGDADGVLAHLNNVGEPLGAAIKEGDGPATILRLELHGPKDQLEKLKPTFDPLGTVYFETGWGFRNATA
jgi:quinol monooxygenase YgiN